MQWQPIENAPDLDRVVVAGWQEPQGRTQGYWWFHEDHTDARGVPIDHPDAQLFVRLGDILPSFPAEPAS